LLLISFVLSFFQVKIMIKSILIRTSLCFCIFFQLASCDNQEDKKPNQIELVGENLYSAFSPGKPRDWGSIELAQQTLGMHGIIEVSKYVNKPQTAEQKKKTDELYNNLIKAIKKNGWLNRDNALKDGYLYEPNIDKTHYHNYHYVFDGEDLDPNKPEVLMYYQTSDGEYLLAGAMFLMMYPFEHGEQIGGNETVWHFHHYEMGHCVSFDFEKWGIKDQTTIQQFEKNVEKGDCKDGFIFERSPEMLHVWTIDHPEGRFATAMEVEEKWLYTGVNQIVE